MTLRYAPTCLPGTRRRVLHGLLLLASALPYCGVAQAGSGLGVAPLDVRAAVYKAAYQPPLVAPVLDSLRVLQQARGWIDTLASTAMAGRGYQHQGHRIAAHYLVQQFRLLGLLPLGPDSSYLQAFPLEVNVLGPAELKLGRRVLTYGEDFISNGYSGPGQGRARLLDLGTGHPAMVPARALAGRVWLIRQGWPDTASSPEPDPQSKVLALVRSYGQLPAAVLLEEKKLTAAYGQQQLPFPAYQVAAGRLHGLGRAWVAYGQQAELRTETAYNVVGWVRGTRQPDTAIVLSAHYDHLGQHGCAIFRGANDNASGTAMLLSLAQAATAVGADLPYSTLFIAFGAEEVALVGSRHYVAHPRWPLGSTRMVLNMDLMGNGDRGVMTVAGKTYPQIYAPLSRLNDSLGLIHPLLARENRPNSDHYPFTQRGVPALFFYTQGGPPHYHDVYDRPEAYGLEAFWVFRRLILAWLAK
ncbi:MAG: M28 family metallopeptidase [Sphingobacteriia bacterium]